MQTEELKRRAAADPQNHSLRLNWLVACQRAGSTAEVLECLKDREQWNAASEAEQELAIAEIGRRIGEGFELSGVRVWSCENERVFHETVDGQVRNASESVTISHRLATFTHKATGIEMQLVPGRPAKTVIEIGAEECKLMNWDASQVTLTDPAKPPFLIARGPVTNRQYRKFKSYTRDGSEPMDLPATGMSFDRLCREIDRNGFSLPTAAQWEYACKAGSNTRFYWGDSFDPSHVWYAGNSGGSCCPDDADNCPFDNRHPHPFKEHDDAGKWNAFGLVDCIGNVWDWLPDGSLKGGCYREHASGFGGGGRLLVRPVEGLEHEIGFRPIKTIPGLS